MTPPEARTKALVRLKHRRNNGPEEPCVRCGDTIRLKKRMVHLIDGGGGILHPEDEHLYHSDAGDMYWYPIGPDCAKIIGLEWSVDIDTHNFRG